MRRPLLVPRVSVPRVFLPRRHDTSEGRQDLGAPAPRHAATPTGEPPLTLQLNALQALCRQVFGFRLVMILLAAPFALSRTTRGLPIILVSAAVVVTFMLSYVLLRDWERFGPILLRHPLLLGVDMLFGALLLVTASPDSTLAYVTICTPLLAGLVYGWRGAAVFAVLQSLCLAGAYAVNDDVHADFNALLLPGLCVAAGAIGSTLRTFMFGFGEASAALTETRARLAAAEAVDEERARLAREMHDSVAKTLHGLALAAEGLAQSVDRMDPLSVKLQAELVARSARRAAGESRELLSDLRREPVLRDDGIDVPAELALRTEDFARRHGVPTTFRRTGSGSLPTVPHAMARQALSIAAEAMENAARHGDASHVDVSAGVVGDEVLRISVYDDGRGLPPGTTLEELRKAGHFGLVGMVERAASIGARIRIGRGAAARGTEVRLELPLGTGREAPASPVDSDAPQAPVDWDTGATAMGPESPFSPVDPDAPSSTVDPERRSQK
jgi:signal transduction histidine kinase